MKRLFLAAAMLLVSLSSAFGQINWKEERVRNLQVVLRHKGVTVERTNEGQRRHAGQFWFLKSDESLSLSAETKGLTIVWLRGELRRDSLEIHFQLLPDSTFQGVAWSYKPVAGWDRFTSMEAMCDQNIPVALDGDVWVTRNPVELLQHLEGLLKRIEWEVTYGYTSVIQ